MQIDAIKKEACGCCGKLVNSDELTEVQGSDGYVCRECLEEYYSSCDDCGEYVMTDELTETSNGGWVCNRCRRNYSICSDCGALCFTGDMETLYNGDLICNDCYIGGDYFRCEGCGEIYPYDMERRDGYCVNCMGEESEYIRGYSDNPSWEPRLTEKDKASDGKPLLLGVELEAGGLETQDDAVDAAKSVLEISDDFLACKEDGSIPDYGFEVVSHPATLNFHNNYKWERILQVMSNHGLRAHDLGENKCGIHIHVNRDFFLGKSKFALLDAFVSKNEDFFTAFARRKSNEWAKFEKGESEKYGMRWNKYSAVNCKHKNTLEIRIFRSTLNFKTFTATLAMVDALARFINSRDAIFLIRNRFDCCEFINFMRGKPEYSCVFDYLKTRGIAVL